MQSYQIVEWGKPLQLRMRETPLPQGEEVLVKIQAAGVCHSDVHIGDGYFNLGGGRRASIEASGATLPLTMGHEMAGTVVAMGPHASGTRIGERVVVYPWVGCGTCAFCLAERDADCEKPRSLGVRRDGGFSDHVLVPKGRFLVPIGDLDHALAATYACSGLTSYGAMKKIPRLAADDRILIIGAGGLGLAAVSVAPLLTDARVLVADIDPGKLETAIRQGAHAGFDTRTPDAANALKAMAGGPIRGVVDFVGSDATVTLALDVVSKGAVVVVVGMTGGLAEISPPTLAIRNLTLRGSYVGTLDELKDLVRFAREGRLPAIPLSARPMSGINGLLEDLRLGRITGRVVTVPDMEDAA